MQPSDPPPVLVPTSLAKRQCCSRGVQPPPAAARLVKRSPRSLLDICAKRVAESIAFQHVEERYDRIPEPVQERIIFWSFPRNERDICMYSSLSRVPASTQEYHNSPFYRGIKLLEMGCVRDVLQVGFHLSGEVLPGLSSSTTCITDTQDRKYKVSVSFERCKITSVTCSCDTKDIFWCQHVVALSLYRIRNADKIRLRVPISETLLQMDREQLQKFVQYLISEHHTEVLPTAQKLADELLRHESAINRIAGAPDPTAGADAEEDNAWHLDEEQIRDQVKSFLSQGGYYNANKQLSSMFAKVREMLRVRDSNGPRMLALMTEQFLADPRLILWKSQGTPMTDKCRHLWDQLGSLWVSVVLNPTMTSREKRPLRAQLEKWSRLDMCPLEDPDFRPQRRSRRERRHRQNRHQADSSGSSSDTDTEAEPSNPASNRPAVLGPSPQQPQSRKRKRGHHHRRRRSPRTVFHKALDALCMDWDSKELKMILTHDIRLDTDGRLAGEEGQMMWTEHLPTSCARVEALKAHGFPREGLRLAVAIVRAMKQKQIKAREDWKKKRKEGSKWKENNVHDPWIGHALNPIGCLFDTLSEPCLSPEDRLRVPHHLEPTVASEDASTSSSSSSSTTITPTVAPITPPLRYRHAPLPDGSKAETYMTLALEAGLIGLGQQRSMPMGLYAQEKACRQEERIIQRMGEVEMDSLLVGTLVNQVHLLLDMGSSSGLGQSVHPESVPMQTFSKYLFLSLLPFDKELAFTVGLRAMRLPILEGVGGSSAASSSAASRVDVNTGESNNADNVSDDFVLSRLPRWFTLGHIEGQQSALASAMMNAAKDDLRRLGTVLECAQRHIHSPSHLFKLAQDAFRHASASAANGVPQQPSAPLLNVAFQLGLQVTRLTLTSVNWRRREIVRWLVTCATELGADALISLMQTWSGLFTPTEATGTVATTIMSHATIMRLGLNFQMQEEMASCARSLALQCAHEDPSNCALNALTLCENEPLSFETAYQVVIDASEKIMTSSQLFTIARYMEHRGYPNRSYKLALLAMKTVHLTYNQDTHPAINDIHWACALSHSLGKSELSALIPLVVKNVQCATVLSDVLRRCSLSLPGMKMRKEVQGERLAFDQEPLSLLLDSAMSAFVATTHSRLSSISPRHYTEFIDFLTKARETFMLARDGQRQFAQLVDNMRMAYKGKKKLIALIRDRFGA